MRDAGADPFIATGRVDAVFGRLVAIDAERAELSRQRRDILNEAEINGYSKSAILLALKVRTAGKCGSSRDVYMAACTALGVRPKS